MHTSFNKVPKNPLLIAFVHQVSYKCEEGFKMSSTVDDDLLITLPRIECLSSAKWQKINFECQPIKCNAEIYLKNGFKLAA